jgi:hypothetical protein
MIHQINQSARVMQGGQFAWELDMNISANVTQGNTRTSGTGREGISGIRANELAAVYNEESGTNNCRT